MRLTQKIIGSIIVGDILHLVYPSLCLVCEKELPRKRVHLCAFCEGELTYTEYHLYEGASAMDQLFWGRIPIQFTYAHLHFKKEAASQTVLFNLKYKNNTQIGLYFGEEIGRLLKPISALEDVDAILPVPLHPKKEFLRGYNQSLTLAKGLGSILKVNVNTSIAKRIKYSGTQTKKSRFQRWDNVNSIFKVHPNVKKYKHIILVDDVITTGSTIEALAQSLRKINPQLSISVVTLAIA